MNKVFVSPLNDFGIVGDAEKSALLAMRMGNLPRRIANFPFNGVFFMKNVKTLASELRTKVEEAKSIDDVSKLEIITGEIEAINKELEARQKLEIFERNANSVTIHNGETRELGELSSRFDIGRAIADYSEGRALRGAEGEYNQENRSKRAGGFSAPIEVFGLGNEQRAITTTTPSGSIGGNLIATNQVAMIDRLRPNLAVQSLGATILSGLTGNVELPRHKSSGGANWVAEHGAATRSDAGFDKVALSPKSVTAEYEVSRRMLLQATQLSGLLQADLAFLLAQALDKAAILGGGTNEPVGIMANSNIQTIALGTNGGALTIDTTADMIGAIDAADVIGSRGFLTNAKVKKSAMKLKDTQGRQYGVPSVFQNEAVAFSNQVPSDLTKGTGTELNAILYGAWADLIVAYWSSVDIVINPYHSDVASKGGVLLHAFLDADIAVRHPESFVVCKDVK